MKISGYFIFSLLLFCFFKTAVLAGNFTVGVETSYDMWNSGFIKYMAHLNHSLASTSSRYETGNCWLIGPSIGVHAEGIPVSLGLQYLTTMATDEEIQGRNIKLQRHDINAALTFHMFRFLSIDLGYTHQWCEYTNSAEEGKIVLATAIAMPNAAVTLSLPLLKYLVLILQLGAINAIPMAEVTISGFGVPDDSWKPEMTNNIGYQFNIALSTSKWRKARNGVNLAFGYRAHKISIEEIGTYKYHLLDDRDFHQELYLAINYGF